MVEKGPPFSSQEWRWGDDRDGWKNMCPLRAQKGEEQVPSTVLPLSGGPWMGNVRVQWVRPRQPLQTRTRGRRGKLALPTAGAGFLEAGFPRYKAWLRYKGNSPNLFKRRKKSRKVDPSTFSLGSSHSLPAQKTKWGFLRLVPERVATRNFLRERRGWRRMERRKAATREAAACTSEVGEEGSTAQAHPCAAPGPGTVRPGLEKSSPPPPPLPRP